jgi:hypothetical protein
MKTIGSSGIAAAAVISILLASSLVFASVSYFPQAGAPTSTVTLTQYLQGNYSVVAPTLASTPCSMPVKSEPMSFTLKADSNHPALLCVAYYFYNDTAPMTLVPQLRIFGWPLHPAGTFSTFDASSNFTVTSSVQSLELGGPARLNEGHEVTFSILAKPGVSGTFEVGVANLLPGGIGCDSDFLLSAGTGVPSYVSAGLCYLVQPSNSSTPLPTGYVFVAFIGAANSTG